MQTFNPFLPSNEYIPDAEPYIYNDRVYIYGSHDRFGAPIFCMNDYVCWSAPLQDLSDWRYEGVIYRKKQDPINKFGLRLLFAPDMAAGLDGRYYLFYTVDFAGRMSVAVSDTPVGPFVFHGYIRFANGRIWGSRSGDELPFDPAVLVDDDGRIYLYSGFATKVPRLLSRFHSLQNSGCVVLELESDMLTVKTGPKLLFPRQGNHPDHDFQNHEFFEASSIRKIDGRYVFVYSSRHNHELCYAISDSPDSGFRFGGTLVDVGDLFLHGNEDETKAANYLGNTHGGMVELNGQWYIFYHRHTNRHSYSRQACAQPLIRTPDGGFQQAEITSCGLNGEPLQGRGRFEARIACNLWSREGTARYDRRFPKKRHPYLTQNGKDESPDAVQYITNMRDGSVAGFKYFLIEKLERICVTYAGCCDGVMQISAFAHFERIAAQIKVKTQGLSMNAFSAIQFDDGVTALYFRYLGKGALDFYSFELI